MISHYNLFCRSDAVEPVLCLSLFPNKFSVKEKVKNWVRVFSGFDKVEVKALEKMLEQKQRFVHLSFISTISSGFCFCLYHLFPLLLLD